MPPPPAWTPQRLFAGYPDSLRIFEAVKDAIEGIGEASVRASKSQVAFRRRRGFAYVWRPGQYVRSDVPAVLSIALPHDVASQRFKDVVHPTPGRWLAHLELRHPEQVDAEVRAWLAEALDAAG